MSDSLKPSLDKHFHNLPVPLTPLVGREQERQVIDHLLVSTETHLLTLTGVGGIGKTRLALAVAADLEPVFKQGVYFVPLVMLKEPYQVLPAIAQALGLREEENYTLIERLKSFLCKKHLLLVLDNFEHITNAALQLVDLLATCPHLKILVTSRALLSIAYEQVFQVPPLGLPDPTQSLTPDNLATCESVTLFVQRAQQVRSEFQLTNGQVRAVVEICIRLEGLPLAIELAAARIKIMTPRLLLSRLEQRLPVLTSMQQDIPVRQQTLRNTIKWSYDLLPEKEQRLFCRLAMFVDGCTLQAIEAVYMLLGENPGSVLDGVTSLLDKSLIQQRDQQHSEPRLLMLETLREFGLECLVTLDELQQCQRAHAEYYHSLVEQAVPMEHYLIYYKSPVDQLKPDYANIHMALSTLMVQGDILSALQMANALGSFWFLREMFSEGCYLLEQIIQASRTHETDQVLQQRTHALFLIGYLTFWQNDVIGARIWLEECLELAQKLENKRACALVLRVLAMIEGWHPGGNSDRCSAMYNRSKALSSEMGDQAGITEVSLALGIQEHYYGQHAHAQELCQESLRGHRSLGYSWGVGISLLYLGWSFYLQGNVAEARGRIEESLALFRMLGNPPYIDDALVVLGLVCLFERDAVRAQALFEEAFSLGETLGKKEHTIKALYGMGYLAQHQGRLAQARARYEESLVAIKNLPISNKTLWVVASCLEGIGSIALVQGMVVWAVHLFAAADTQRKRLVRYTPIGIEHPDYERALENAKVQLGKKNFSIAWEEGQRMTPEQALTSQSPANVNTVPLKTALAVPEHTLRPSHLSAESSRSAKASDTQAHSFISPNDLTERETEVLRLVAKGLTDVQVAQTLVISPRTVNAHLRSIYSKLGITSRHAATLFAIEQNLL